MPNGQTVLITGGAGYIGSHAVKYFLAKGYGVVVFDNLFRGWKEPLETLSSFGPLKFIRGDLRNEKDVAEIFSQNKIDAVLHFAALCLPDESMERPELYFSNNVSGSLNLFEGMRQAGVEKVIFSSTCAVYGESQYLPMDEKHPTNPANPYGESKLMAEKILRWYGQIHDFKYAILRYFNVCGADRDGLIGDGKKPSQLLLQNAVRGAMGIEPFLCTCPAVDTPDRTPIRDYIDVEDLVKAHHQAYEYLTHGGRSDIFNLGNGRGWSVGEIAEEVEKFFQVKLGRKKGEVRKGEYAAVYADPSKARKTLEWQSEKSLQNSIASLQKWYAGHPHGYRR